MGSEKNFLLKGFCQSELAIGKDEKNPDCR